VIPIHAAPAAAAVTETAKELMAPGINRAPFMCMSGNYAGFEGMHKFPIHGVDEGFCSVKTMEASPRSRRENELERAYENGNRVCHWEKKL